MIESTWWSLAKSKFFLGEILHCLYFQSLFWIYLLSLGYWLFAFVIPRSPNLCPLFSCVPTNEHSLLLFLWGILTHIVLKVYGFISTVFCLMANHFISSNFWTSALCRNVTKQNFLGLVLGGKSTFQIYRWIRIDWNWTYLNTILLKIILYVTWG